MDGLGCKPFEGSTISSTYFTTLLAAPKLWDWNQFGSMNSQRIKAVGLYLTVSNDLAVLGTSMMGDLIFKTSEMLENHSMTKQSMKFMKF